ncbi:MAG: DUF4159 domain-containing protein [Vicinamibacterales bacterium]|jgi:hypothetical protein|nr:DUF4159 domain-containing protein [Vicinamibacterales bacterium]
MSAQRGRQIVAGVLAGLLLASIAGAQWGYRRSRYPPRLKPAGTHDNGFSFCRLMYQSGQWGRGRWSTDYPFADINFMVRLSELTSTPVNFDDRGEPKHWVVPIADDTIFTCPFIVASAVGTMTLSGDEAARLREYLLKGGFLWADDFWGSVEWEQWVGEISKVLPPAQFPIVDLPLDHPLFHGQFYIWEIPQISNIGFWRDTGGTSERGADSAEPHFRVIQDRAGRIMVAMTHNTDIQDAWEREGEDQGFFEAFSPDGYALGVNVLLHAMTH